MEHSVQGVQGSNLGSELNFSITIWNCTHIYWFSELTYTNEVSDTASIYSECNIRGDKGTSSSSPSGIIKDHPITDDQGAATVLGSSSGKNMAQE